MSGPGPSSHRDPHRRRLRPVSPSPPLLAFLATLAASTPGAAAGPLSFLYPFINPEPVPAPVPVSKRKVSRRATSVTQLQAVPVKYEPTDDGTWRKVESYSLYGSTMCKSCSPPVAVDNIDVSAVPSADTNPVDFLTNLPKGWKDSVKTPPTELIIALSLVLAFVICLLIIACLFWRKFLRRKFRHDDVEMKPKRRRPRPRPVDEISLEIELPSRQKKDSWSRATARWRANARYTARQRRGRRGVATPRSANMAVTGSSTALSYVSDSEPQPLGPVRSPASSRRPSVSEASVSETDRTSISAQADAPDPPCPHPAAGPSFPSSPPAYHQRSSVQITIPTSSSEVVGSSHSTVSRSASPRTYSPSRHAAHVATDDKALLEQLAQSASVPPLPRDGPLNRTEEGIAGIISSAPTWEDEELDDFNLASTSASNPSHSSSPLAPPFPPPLSKGEIDAFYDYSYSFQDDMPGFEPQLGPSAPPFQEDETPEPSAPPIEENDTLEVEPNRITLTG